MNYMKTIFDVLLTIIVGAAGITAVVSLFYGIGLLAGAVGHASIIAAAGFACALVVAIISTALFTVGFIMREGYDEWRDYRREKKRRLI
jgi:hypothetical protein